MMDNKNQYDPWACRRVGNKFESNDTSLSTSCNIHS